MPEDTAQRQPNHRRSDVEPVCGWCGKPPTGSASIGDVRYCHPDDGPSCYEAASRSTTPLEMLGTRRSPVQVGEIDKMAEHLSSRWANPYEMLAHIDALTAERDALRAAGDAMAGHLGGIQTREHRCGGCERSVSEWVALAHPQPEKTDPPVEQACDPFSGGEDG